MLQNKKKISIRILPRNNPYILHNFTIINILTEWNKKLNEQQNSLLLTLFILKETNSDNL